MSTKLTAKEENFCQAIADGMTQADAYRTAYNAENMADKTIWEKASGLMAKEKVKARVAELKSALSEKLLWSREMSVKGLITAYNVAREAKQSTGMTAAIKELNNMHGYNEPKKIELKSSVIEVVRATRPD